MTVRSFAAQVVACILSGYTAVHCADLKREALQAELAYISEAPEAYYVVLDLAGRTLDLKVSGRLLARSPIQSFSLAHLSEVTTFRYAARLPTFTVEAGPRRGRLGGRPLPLDFVGRLIEGPRKASTILCDPPLAISEDRVPGIPHVNLAGHDVKSLAFALEPGSMIIVVPPDKSE